MEGGIRPFGYELDDLTVRESEATKIRRIAAAVVRGQSLRSLAFELNEQKYDPQRNRVPPGV
jgi:hypothetical protein